VTNGSLPAWDLPAPGPKVRACSIPEGVTLFFPVINIINFDTPNACGQGDPLPTSVYRELSAAFIDGSSNLSASVDGQPIKQLHRVRSPVFAVALPEENVFNGPRRLQRHVARRHLFARGRRGVLRSSQSAQGGHTSGEVPRRTAERWVSSRT
jgi:hypothetical protein